MYAAVWRVLPGPLWVRILLAALLVVAILFALVVWVFPLVDTLIGPQDVTVQ